MESLFLAWQHPTARTWVPVGRLTFDKGLYKFVYTKGAERYKEFVPFGRMTDLRAIYESEQPFPLFANRLMAKSRPEYEDYLRWLNLPPSEDNPIALLSLSGGIRGTDSLEVFPMPRKNERGNLEAHFFSHGLRHLPPCSVDAVTNLKIGDRLFLAADVQNSHDAFAIMLRTGDPVSVVGYCPRYLAEDLTKLLSLAGPEHIEVTVEQVNHDAPLQLRLLCQLTAPWPRDFNPFESEDFISLAPDSLPSC